MTTRGVWNSAIWSDPELRWLSNIPTIFGKIKGLLFEALVLEKLAISDERLANDEPWENRFQVVPNVPCMGETYRVASLTTLTRRTDGGINGDRQIQVRDSDVTLLFVDFFNWGNIGYLDFSLILVRVVGFRSHPELIGSEALIEVSSASIILSDA